MTDQEIRAKALEIAVLMKGREDEKIIELTHHAGGLIHRYLGLTSEIEQFIRQGIADQKGL